MLLHNTRTVFKSVKSIKPITKSLLHCTPIRTMSMKALVYQGPNKKAWTDVPKPEIQNPTDAIVKITSTTICGTDLHILKGDTPEVKTGTILGHEGVGVVESVGSAVESFKKGDRVLVSCITSCGKCVYCARNMASHCKGGGWILGHLINGTQAEYVRTPHADGSLHALPKDLKDEQVIMLSDALPTGYEVGVLMGKVQPSDSVAVVGAGPVGLAAIFTSQFYSPSQIIAIDSNEDRLKAAVKMGATHTINPATVTNVKEAIYGIQTETLGDYVPENQRPEPGVDVAIECVGIPQTFETCQDIINPGGRIANVGVHGAKVDLHLEDLWIKNINISTGLVSASSTRMLLKALIAGKLGKPEDLITHKFKLADIEEAYKVFGNAGKENAIKVFLQAD